jgi:hypothetical protein
MNHRMISVVADALGKGLVAGPSDWSAALNKSLFPESESRRR